MTEQDYKFYLNEGIDKTNQGKFEEALEVIEKAQRLNPQNALIYFSKAIAYHNLNQLRAACENYDKALKLDNKMVDAYYNKAQAILARTYALKRISDKKMLSMWCKKRIVSQDLSLFVLH